MTRLIEVYNCCLSWEYVVYIPFVLRESFSNGFLRFANISLFAICRYCNLPIKFVSFNLLALQDEGTVMAGLVAFLHTFYCPFSFLVSGWDFCSHQEFFYVFLPSVCYERWIWEDLSHILV